MNKRKRIPVIDMTLIMALIELDIWLKKNELSIEMKILGGTALHLHYIDIARATTDIDLANNITDDHIWDKIRLIGRTEGMEESWIECTDIPIPKGARFISHNLFNQFDAIDGLYIDINSLILTKIASYYDRLHIQQTDIDDIEQTIKDSHEFTQDIIDQGEIFIRSSRSKPINEQRLQEVINDLIGLL